jgi:2-amino-4-hydroxy-6-hydroxymethyldihydropteridine diphosphokinase
MTTVFLGIGSNIDREASICAGLDALARTYGELRLSPVYESAAIGFDGAPFLNLVAALETDQPLDTMARGLRELEYAMGRPRDASRFSSRTLDIDILTYAELVGCCEGVDLPRPEITENAFVLRPLAELAPDVLHPALGCSYAELWSGYDVSSQPLTRVAFEWQGRSL